MTEKTEERIPAAEPGVDRFALLAGAVAGRKVAVAPADAPRSYTDGERIFVSADEVGHPRDTLVVQALLAVGSLDPKLVARTTGRKALRHRYLTPRGGPGARGAPGRDSPRHLAADRVALLRPAPGVPEESLRLAGSDEVPEAPEWLGTIRPTTLLRNSTAVGGAPTEKDRKGQSKQVDMPELDEDEDSERSKIMELFSAPALQNPLARYLQKLLGMGTSPDPEGGGGEELPVGGQRSGRVGRNAKPMEEGWRSRSTWRGPRSGACIRSGIGRSAATAPTGAQSPSTTPGPEEEPRLDPGEDRGCAASSPASVSPTSGIAARTRATSSTSPR